MLTTSANDFFITFAAMMNLDLLTAAEAEALQQLINGATRVVLTGHKSPDGDALGSSLGWAFYLRQLGKQVQVVISSPMPWSRPFARPIWCVVWILESPIG